MELTYSQQCLVNVSAILGCPGMHSFALLQDLYRLVVEQACKAGFDKLAVAYMDKIRGKYDG